MKVSELIDRLNKVDDKNKDVYIYLSSVYGNDYDLETNEFIINEDEYSVTFTDE